MDFGPHFFVRSIIEVRMLGLRSQLLYPCLFCDRAGPVKVVGHRVGKQRFVASVQIHNVVRDSPFSRHFFVVTLLDYWHVNAVQEVVRVEGGQEVCTGATS